MRSDPNNRPRPNRRGVTLTEILIVIVIIMVLMGIGIPSYYHLVKKAEASKCIQRMKGLWTGMKAYMDEEKKWPQMPQDLGQDEEALWKWWYDILEPYDVGKELWLCPTEEKDLVMTGREEFEHAGSYVPSNFDARELTPYRWDQPWFMERADFHGTGANIIMRDGTIKSNPFAKPYDK